MSKRRKSAGRRKRAHAEPTSWFEAKRPVLRFVLLFGLSMGIFYVASVTPFAENRAWPFYQNLNAEISGAILVFMGQDVTVSERLIRSPHSSLLIERGCDAVHPSALFVSAVLASPVPFWAKLPGMLLGTLALMFTNLVRIVSLYFIQIHFPRAFEIMHVEVWQVAFIFFAVLLWGLWAAWARARSWPADAPA